MTDVHVHDAAHTQSHDHGHQQTGLIVMLGAALHLPGFTHDHDDTHILADDLEGNELGIRTIKLALLALGFTTLLQALICPGQWERGPAGGYRA